MRNQIEFFLNQMEKFNVSKVETRVAIFDPNEVSNLIKTNCLGKWRIRVISKIEKPKKIVNAKISLDSETAKIVLT